MPIFTTTRLSDSRLAPLTPNPTPFGKENLHNINIDSLLHCHSERKRSLNKKGWEKGCEKKEIRLMHLREEKDRKELENCTFQPNVNSKMDRPKRSLGEFLEEQDNFTRKVNAKKELIKEHLDEK